MKSKLIIAVVLVAIIAVALFKIISGSSEPMRLRADWLMARGVTQCH